MSRMTIVLAGLLAAGACMGAAPSTLPTSRPAETREQRDARMAWWREAKFGMFVHWGLYAIPAGEWKGKPVTGGPSEWVMNLMKVPVAEYAELAGKFDPVRFDADAWVRAAKGAGMRYIVITSKHHDGFAMFDSAASDFTIVKATPFKRDPLKELAAACAKHGVRLGFYYSQGQDWHHKGGGVYGKHWDPTAWGDSDAYVDNVAIPQVRELLSNYGPVAVLWWDTPAGIDNARAARLDAVLALQPAIITNDRLGGGFKGDTGTPENHIPHEVNTSRDWEVCMTMNNNWGYHRKDEAWKSPGTLVFQLMDVVSKGGNYLLNVGPTELGEIPAPSLERLAAVGKWMEVNGEAVYGAGPTPFGPELGAYSETEKDAKGKPVFKGRRAWRATTKPGRIYVTLFEWPGERFVLDGVKGRVVGAKLLGGDAVRVMQVGDSVSFELPPAPLNPLGTVLSIEVRQ